MRHNEIQHSIAVDITERHSHPRFGSPFFVHGTAALNRLFREGAILMIDPQSVGGPIVRDKNIWPAVTREIGTDNPKTERFHPPDPSGFSYVRELNGLTSLRIRLNTVVPVEAINGRLKCW